MLDGCSIFLQVVRTPSSRAPLYTTQDTKDTKKVRGL